MATPQMVQSTGPSDNEYSIAWISTLALERDVAVAMFDEYWELPARIGNDPSYYCGRIGLHNVVLLYAMTVGISSLREKIQDLLEDFPHLKLTLVVGIGGGIPSEQEDVRLGDIVVSQSETGPSLLRYQLNQETREGILVDQQLPQPLSAITDGLTAIQSKHMRCKNLTDLLRHRDAALEKNRHCSWQHPGIEHDMLCQQTSSFTKDSHPDAASDEPFSQRPRRFRDLPVVHYGKIATGDWIIRDARVRDEISAKLGGILCIDMDYDRELFSLQVLKIRGISDYCNKYKSREFQGYAACMAAAYAKEFLTILKFDLPRLVAMPLPSGRPIYITINSLGNGPIFVGNQNVGGDINFNQNG